MPSRHGTTSRAGTKRFTSKPDLVSTTLVYPMLMTTGAANTDNFLLTFNSSVPASQQGFQVRNSAGTVLWTIPPVGGPKTNAVPIRAAHTVGGAYVALNGAQNPPCVELADGTGQGSKIWAGTGAPSASTVGTATAGDYFWSRPSTAAPTLVESVWATVSATTSLSTTGGGVQVGDLAFVLVGSQDASLTATIGATSAIAADITASDGTNRARIFSKKLVAADISSGNVTITASIATGSGRRIGMAVFHHPNGWGALVGSGQTNTTASGTTVTLTESTAMTGAGIGISVDTITSTSQAQTFAWDGGSALTQDAPVGANVGAHMGINPNTAGTATGYAASASRTQQSVVIASFGAAQVRACAAGWYQSAQSALYVCTAGGTPGTWAAVL